jgi:hypothetical protein
MENKMLKCEIQWIDSNGDITPDNSPAVAMIKTTFAELVKLSASEGRVYVPTPMEPSPCCAWHLNRLEEMQKAGRALDWEIVETL